jgi:hypothetical protein
MKGEMSTPATLRPSSARIFTASGSVTTHSRPSPGRWFQTPRPRARGACSSVVAAPGDQGHALRDAHPRQGSGVRALQRDPERGGLSKGTTPGPPGAGRPPRSGGGGGRRRPRRPRGPGREAGPGGRGRPRSRGRAAPGRPGRRGGREAPSTTRGGPPAEGARPPAVDAAPPPREPRGEAGLDGPRRPRSMAEMGRTSCAGAVMASPAAPGPAPPQRARHCPAKWRARRHASPSALGPGVQSPGDRPVAFASRNTRTRDGGANGSRCTRSTTSTKSGKAQAPSRAR